MYILGLNHGEINSSAALLNNSQIIAATGEERFSRIKKTKSFLKNAIKFCLEYANIHLKNCDYIAQGWNPGECWNFFNHSSISEKRIRREDYLFSIPDNHTIILLQHSVTTQNEYTEKQIKTTLKAITQIGYETIAISPNADPGNSKIFKQLSFLSKKYNFVNFYASLPREDYLGFLKYGGVLIGNSSSGLIEGSYFGIPVINIGSRQIGREKAKNVIDVTNDVSDTIKRKLLSATNSKKHRYPRSYIYGKGNSSKKIVKYLETIKISKELIEKRLL